MVVDDRAVAEGDHAQGDHGSDRRVGFVDFEQNVVDGLRGRPALLSQPLLEQMVAPHPGGTHRLGWDGKAAEGSAAGSVLGPRTFGHLGFTGTSLFCDPKRELVISLLTNRVYPDPEKVTIRSFRPAFHDAVANAFDGE